MAKVTHGDSSISHTKQRGLLYQVWSSRLGDAVSFFESGYDSDARELYDSMIACTVISCAAPSHGVLTVVW